MDQIIRVKWIKIGVKWIITRVKWIKIRVKRIKIRVQRIKINFFSQTIGCLFLVFFSKWTQKNVTHCKLEFTTKILESIEGKRHNTIGACFPPLSSSAIKKVSIIKRENQPPLIFSSRYRISRKSLLEFFFYRFQ